MNIRMKDWRLMDISEKVEAIKKVYESGYSSAQIASLIPGAVRNGIISLYHRKPDEFTECPLPCRAKRGSRQPNVPRIVRTSTIRAALSSRRKSGPPKPPIVFEPPIQRPDMRLVMMMDLGRGKCKWPAEGVGAETRFCGCAVHEMGKPYCEFHRRLSVQP